MIVVGIMTGTSVDGVDIVVVDFKNADSNYEILSSAVHDFPKKLQKSLIDLIAGSPKTCEFICEVEESYEDMLTGILINYMHNYNIDLIAMHGQTIFHRPKTVDSPARSWQIGRGRKICSELGIPVAFDFRHADILKGGHGAPLMPAVDKAINKDSEPGKIMLNIGGLANLSFFDKSGNVGYDVGPGNCLIDIVAQEKFGKGFDEGGNLAAKGTVNQLLLRRLLSDSYFSMPQPKSTGREYFNRELIKDYLDKELISDFDLIATVTSLTTESIIKDVQKIGSARSLNVFGGGARNHVIMETLRKRLPSLEVSVAKSSDYLEALGFAILGFRRWYDVPSVTTTGASGSVILGELCKP